MFNLLDCTPPPSTTQWYMCIHVYHKSVSEIKLFDFAPAGCTPSEAVHPGSSPCTLLVCSNDKWLKKCAQSECTSLKIVHPALKMCTPGAGCMLNFGHCKYMRLLHFK